MSTTTQLLTHGFEALARGLGALWRSFTPRLPRSLFSLFGLFAVMEAILVSIIIAKHEFSLLDPIVLLFFVRKLLLDFALLLAVVTLLLKIPRTDLPAVLFCCAYFSTVAGDAGIYYWGNTLFSRHHLDFFTWYSIRFFAGPALAVFVAAPIVLALLSARALRKLRPWARWGSILKWGALAALCYWVQPNDYIYKFKTADERLDRHIFRFRNEQLAYSTQNSMINFVNEVFLKEVTRELVVTDDLAPYEEVIADYGLPLGERRYPSLGLAPFDKIVVFATESLNLDVIKAHNPKLPLEPAPFFLGTPEIVGKTFTSFVTSAQPTLPGLTATYFSHPNYELPAATGYRNSLVKLLQRRGYKTIFLRSASKFYADENIVFKNFGFQEIIAREDFYDRPELRKYIYGWGLEDRLLYAELVKLLKRYRGQKVFITVLGTDTHPPHGQEHYHHLDYPPLPAGFEQAFGANPARFLKSIHHLDYDLRQTVTQLEEEGLFGEDTLLVITADHSCPFNYITGDIPGHPRTSIERIPLVLLTPQQLPRTSLSQRASQLDLAPTLVHLLDLPVPRGWWGESLFFPGKRNPYVGYDSKMLFVERGEQREVINTQNPRQQDQALLELFNTLIVDGTP